MKNKLRKYIKRLSKGRLSFCDRTDKMQPLAATEHDDDTNTLSPVHAELLAILESFMHNGSYELPEEFVDAKQLFQLAQAHKLFAVVFEQIRTNRIWEKEEYRNLMPLYKRMAVRDVMLQMQRTEGFLCVYEKLSAAGIQPLVMKGMICRNLYSKSDYRISGDEDMLVPREQFTKCDEILLQEGFKRDIQDMNNLPYEIPYLNPRNGVYIELHFSLFPEESGAYGHLNDEFTKVHTNRITEEIQGRQVWTMCPTDHLFYLICHSFKHFLHGGFGIRQVADMIMMAEHYGSQINWAEILERVERLNMKSYWDALIKIGTSYLGFSLEKAMYPVKKHNAQIDCKPLLKDLLDSGIYGDSSMERKHSSNMTLTAATVGKANTTASIGNSLFPDVSYMKRSFTWLQKYPWLLPVAYMIRIVRYLKKHKKDSADGRNSVQIGMDRVELLKKYDIIE